jgi:hypothetical protein
MLIIRLEFIEQSLSQTPGTLKFHHSSRTLVDYFYFDFSEVADRRSPASDPVCPSIELER